MRRHAAATHLGVLVIAVLAAALTGGLALAMQLSRGGAVDASTASADATANGRASQPASRDLNRLSSAHPARPSPAASSTPSPAPSRTATPATPPPTPARPRTPNPQPAVPVGCAGYGGNQRIACTLLPAYGFAQSQMAPLIQLWVGESNWRTTATNPSSGAYGIPQALPAGKMASAGSDWRTNPATQIRWGLGYIKTVYGTPARAWAAWQSRSPHWY